MRWQPREQWPRWVVASGLLHALLVGGFVLLGGTITRPAATLRAHLVTVAKTVSASPPERRTPARPTPPPTMPASPARPVKASTASSPLVSHTAAESSPAEPVPPPEAVRGIAGPPVASTLPSGAPGDDGGSGAPAGPPGEGATRSLLPRAGPDGSRAESTSPAAGVEPSPARTHLQAAARGVFLMPGGSGSGTGRAGFGAADQGAGTGGAGASQAGTGGNGAGQTGRGGSGQAGGGGAGLASRGGGSGDGIADLLRSIRRQIEQAKTYPDAARREGIQGTVELRFRIAADGSVEAVEVLRSSGSGILDEASLQTIRRAAPYPLVRGWIRLPLAYRLDR
jgi:TonB family protein